MNKLLDDAIIAYQSLSNLLHEDKKTVRIFMHGVNYINKSER